MKKEYVSPKMSVIELKRTAPLLVGSAGEVRRGGDSLGGMYWDTAADDDTDAL